MLNGETAAAVIAVVVGVVLAGVIVMSTLMYQAQEITERVVAKDAIAAGLEQHPRPGAGGLLWSYPAQ